jgi:transketolase
MALHDSDMKTVYSDTLVELMKENENIVCLEADLGRSSGTYPKVKDAFPDRFINVGVAESNMVSVSAGLANDGKIPFCASFSAFAARRAYDQSTISVAYSNNNVKIVGLSPGITATYNGGTHMCLQDLAIMRAMPNMHVYSPCDAYELKAVMKYMAKEKQPTYLQMMREKYPAVFDENVEFDPMKAKVLHEGSDLTIVTTGYATQILVKTYALLDAAGIKFDHLHYASIKPFDRDTLIASVKKTGRALTVENQSVIGGLGSAVCETVSEFHPVPVKRLGAQDRFGEVGNIDYLAEAMGFSPKQIADACIAMKKQG